MTGLMILVAGLVTAWAVGDPVYAVAGTALWVWAAQARAPQTLAHLEAARAGAVRADIRREIAGRALWNDTERRVDALAQAACALADRDGELAALEARAVAIQDPVIARVADARARVDLEAAQAAAAESLEHASAISNARERGLAQLARIRCTLEAVLAKVLTIKALELEGDELESAGRRHELAALSREMTALTEAVAETWRKEIR